MMRHIGTATTLAAIATADISNGDIAYIWLNSYNCKMVFDSASTKATNTTDRPYCQRPSDYVVSGEAGVWVEDCGANEVLSLSGDQVRQGCILSNNWIDGTSGMKIDLDNEQILIKDDTFGSPGIQLGWFSSAYKFHVGDADSYIIWDGSALSVKMASGETFDLVGSLSVTGNIVLGTNGAIYSTGKTSFADTDAGFFLGYDTDAYKLNIGDANCYIKFDGVELTINVKKNAGGTEGMIYKDGHRWLYDLSPDGTEAITLWGDNLFLGYDSGNPSMGGASVTETFHASYNTGLGAYTLQGLTLGYFNTAIGPYALQDNTTGYYNTAIGPMALLNVTTGHENVGIGTYAGTGLTTGFTNVCIGTQSGYSLTEGEANTAVGHHALYSPTTSGANTAIGHAALYAASSGENNVGIGTYALFNNETGEANIAIGSFAGFYYTGSNNLTTPSYSIYIGAGAFASAATISNEIAIGTSAAGQGANTIMLGNSSVTGLYCYDTSISSPSDKRVKKDIETLPPALEFIKNLAPITYRRINPADWDESIKPEEYKDKAITFNGKVHKLPKKEKEPDNLQKYVGLIAQDVEKLMTQHQFDFDLVKTSPLGMKSIAYSNLIMPIITAMQELYIRLEAVESKLN